MQKPMTVDQAAILFRKNYLTIRAEKGFTQADMFQKTGIAQPQLSALELGRTVPSLSTLCRLGKALGVGPAEFLLDD
jgi:transcriptional regulator with XRE-family HTH domain